MNQIIASEPLACDLSAFVDADMLNTPFVDIDAFFLNDDSSSTTNSEHSFPHIKDPEPENFDISRFSSSVSELSHSPSYRTSVKTPSVSGDSVSNLDASTIQHLVEEQNLKKQRLARKAELARQTRKKKKERLDDLELEVKRLKAEISCLRKRNSEIMEMSRSGQNVLVDEVVVEEQKNIQKSIEKVVYASSLEGQSLSTQNVSTLVEELMEVFTKRSLTSKSHLYSLEACLSPCMPLRFLNWAMCQDDKFYQDPQGLWSSLFKQQLGLSDEQLQGVLSLREEMTRQRQLSNKVEEVYKVFKPLVEKQIAQTEENLDRLRSILSSEQLAKFFVWVEQNQLCVRMLESVLH